MYWKEKDTEGVVEHKAVHEGEGSVSSRLFFEDVSSLPVTVAVWELEPGVSEGSHIHAGDGALEEMYYFLAGEGTMWVDGRDDAVSAGDAVLVPAGADHGFRNTGSAPLRLVLIWGRPRA